MSASAAEHRLRINRIQIDTRMSMHGRRQNVWAYILSNELQHGTQFVYAEPSGQLYMVIGETNQVMSVPRAGRGGDKVFAYLYTTYGMHEHEVWTRAVYDLLRHHIHDKGIHAELRRFSKYDATTKTAYLSAYNGRMFKVDGSTITEATIGDDGVFFVDDDNGVHVDPEIGNHGLLWPSLLGLNFAPNGLSGITPEQQQMAMVIWIMALAFPDLLPHKPILMLEGARGAGKTSAVVLVQLALMGIDLPMQLQRDKENDFGVILLRSPIALFDNTDSYIDWVPDAIAGYTTGGKIQKRRLYTDDESMIIKPHAFIAVATRNPASFRRDDVADRCVILRLERRSSNTAASTLQQAILTNRPRLFGEYLWHVGQVIEELRRRGTNAANESYRMADFAAFGRAVGSVMGWSDDDVSKLFTALSAESDAFINEEDPLIDLLRRWIAYRPRNGPSNIGRGMTATELHQELTALAESATIVWKDSPRSLQSKLRSTHIEREFSIETITVNQQRKFKLRRHSDAHLEVVDDASGSIQIK